MKPLKNQHGISLVELVIALAITALLVAGAITARGGLSQETSFNTSIDQVRNSLLRIQNEAFSGVKAGTNGLGKSNKVVFGKLVEFSDTDKKIMKVYTLIGDAENESAMLQACDPETITLPNQLEFSGPSPRQSIIYTRESGSVFVAPSTYPAINTTCTAPTLATNSINNGTTSPPPGPPPATCATTPGVATPFARDCRRIEGLNTIRGMLGSYASTRGGRLPTTSAYGDVDSGQWDYSSQNGTVDTFLPFLSPVVPPNDPSENGNGDIFFGGTGNAYGYYCYDVSPAWPTSSHNKLALGVKLEQPGDYSSHPNFDPSTGAYWSVPGMFESGFVCDPTPPAPQNPVTISPNPYTFSAWHMFNTAGTKPTQVFTVTNPAGSAPINLTTTVLSGATTSFSINSNSCAGTTLAAGATCAVTIQFFPPSGPSNNRLSNAGLKSATLTINNANAVAATSVNISGHAVSDRMGPGDIMPSSSDPARSSIRAYSPSCYSNALACSAALVQWAGVLALYPDITVNNAPWIVPGAYSTEMRASDGNLIAYNSSNNPIWATGAAPAGTWLMIFSDGQLWRMQPDWQSSSSGYSRVWP